MSLPYPYRRPETQRTSSRQDRRHTGQPPHLVTSSLSTTRNAILASGAVTQTPLSSTSLSSPFSAIPQSACPASPVDAMRGTSPMAFRSTVGYATAYNPQQWAPVSNNSPSSSSTATNHARLPQFSRVATLAPRPVGPDGKLFRYCELGP